MHCEMLIKGKEGCSAVRYLVFIRADIRVFSALLLSIGIALLLSLNGALERSLHETLRIVFGSVDIFVVLHFIQNK
jgi:hypothetical protein